MPGSRSTATRVTAVATAVLLLFWWFLRSGAEKAPPSPPTPPQAPRTEPPLPPPPAPPAVEAPGPPTPVAVVESAPPPAPPTHEPEDWVLTGIVRAEGGLPVEGARVEPDWDGMAFVLPDGTLLREEELTPLLAAVTPAVTDGDGRFNLRVRLHEGLAFSIVVSARGFLPARAGIVLAALNRDYEHVFELEPAEGIEGRVMDQEGAPVVGAHVFVRRVDGDAIGREVLTGADGRFRIEETPDGEVDLHAVPPPAPPRGEWATRVVHRLVRGGDRDADLVLTWAEVEGATVVVSVVDPATGDRVAVRKADCLPLDGWYLEKVPTAATMPERGREGVTLRNIRPGSWRLWVETAAGKSRYADFVVEPGVRDLRTTLEVEETGSLQGTLDRGGVPVDPLRSPVVNYELVGNGSFPQFAFLDESRKTGKDESLAGLAPVSSEGRFRAQRLLPGTYLLTVLDGRCAAMGRATVLPGKTATVNLVAQRIGRIRVSATVPEGAGGWRLSIWPEGGIRKQGSWKKATPGSVVVGTMEISPGPVHWHVLFTAAGESEVSAPPLLVKEGLEEVTPGPEKVVEVGSE